MNTRSAAARAAASLGALARLAACGKVQEAASERVVEKAIESSMAKDGATGRVDMSGGDGAALSLLDDKAKRQLQVHVGKDERGSSIVLHRTSGF